MRNYLFGAVWLLRCALCVVQAVETMHTTSQDRQDNRIHVGSPLRLATWNCGGLSFTHRELCRELNYDILSLTEIHHNGTLKSKPDFICNEQAPPNESSSGCTSPV